MPRIQTCSAVSLVIVSQLRSSLPSFTRISSYFSHNPCNTAGSRDTNSRSDLSALRFCQVHAHVRWPRETVSPNQCRGTWILRWRVHLTDETVSVRFALPLANRS